MMKSENHQRNILALSNSEVFQREMSKFQYFELPNATGVDKYKKKYIVNSQNQETILEIVEVSAEGSMFIGQNVKSNGSFLNFIEIDPLLLAIPFLNTARGVMNEEKKGYYKQLDEIFKSDDLSLAGSFKILQENKRIFRNLKKICESQSHDPDEKLDFFRLDNSKLKAYIDDKIVKAQQLFEKNEQYLTFQKLSTKEKIEDSLYFGIEFAFNFLPTSLFNKVVLEPRNISVDDFQSYKKAREGAPKYDFYSAENEQNQQNNNTNDAQKQKSKQITPAKQSNTELKNIEAAKNTKPISSFFKKK